MGTVIVLLAVGICIGLALLWTGSTAREGSYRRGNSWYLDVSTPREVLQGRSRMWDAGVPSPWSVHLLFAGSMGLVVLAALAWLVAHSEVMAIIVALLGALVLGLAWDARRRRDRAGSRSR